VISSFCIFVKQTYVRGNSIFGIRTLLPILFGFLPLILFWEPVIARGEIGEAQHKFIQRFIDAELEELLLSNGVYPKNFSERATWLSYCKYGWASCKSAIGTLLAPTDNRKVSLVCLEVKGLKGLINEADRYAHLFNKNEYSFDVIPASKCTVGLVDERTYTVSVVFSNCSEHKCSSRTHVKRNREWCATGWKTNKFTSLIDGFQFEVLNGLKEEILGTGNNRLLISK
jgi:hypothetical protein